MSLSIDSQLNEFLRDALDALFLHVVVPNDKTIKDLKLDDKIKTANDIYEYLLLDVLVSQNVPTSPVACAIASLQQYVNGILMNMEPGYEQASLTAEQIKRWRNEMHQYPLWAANQELKYFPALYLAPALRLNKTDNFRQLENDINQNQIQPETVQTAVLAYLARFEEIANLNVLNGYIDGEDFANSIYYFIGKSRAENAYYWRSLDMRQRRPTGAPGTFPAQPPNTTPRSPMPGPTGSAPTCRSRTMPSNTRFGRSGSIIVCLWFGQNSFTRTRRRLPLHMEQKRRTLQRPILSSA